MTLLDATATLIDTAKTYAEHDRAVMRAVKRMEKRLRLLQLRSLKATRRRRHFAWKTLQHLNPVCDCSHRFTFIEFIHAAEIDHRGWIKLFICPHCRRLVVLLEVKGNCTRYLNQQMLEAEK